MMWSRKLYLIVILTLFAFTTCKTKEVQKNKKDFSQLKGAYLGQNPPGMTPELFAPGIITIDTSEGCSGWGKDMEYFIFQRWIDGKEFYFTRNKDGLAEPTIFVSRFEKSGWTDP